MSAGTRVLVFHRNGLFRDALATYLRGVGGYDAQPVDHGNTEEIEELLHDRAALLLLDLNLPDGLTVEVARAVRDGGLSCRLVILVPDEQDRLLECIGAGVHGCVLERSSLDELQIAIERVLRGQTYCSPEIVGTMFAELPRFQREPVPPPMPDLATAIRLTTREKQVLDLLVKRKSNKEIAKLLSVSVYTVKNHVHNILEKLNLGSRLEAIEFAREHRWLSRL